MIVRPLIVVGVLQITFCQLQAAEQPTHPEIKKIIQGIQANCAAIKTVEGEFEEAHEDRSAKGQREVAVFIDGDTQIELTKYANLWHAGQFNVDGQDYRVVRIRSDTKERSSIEKNDKTWTVIYESRKSVYNQRGLPGRLAENPQEFPSDNLRYGPIEMLQQHDVWEVLDIEDSRLGTLRRIVFKDANAGSKIVWDIDPRRSHLPVRYFTTWPDTDNVVQVAEITYREVLNGKAHYPRKLVRRFFDQGVSTTPESADWRQQLTWTLTKLKVNAGVDLSSPPPAAQDKATQ